MALTFDRFLPIAHAARYTAENGSDILDFLNGLYGPGSCAFDGDNITLPEGYGGPIVFGDYIIPSGDALGATVFEDGHVPYVP